MSAKISIEYNQTKYEVSLEAEEVQWEKVLEAAVKLLKSHTENVQEVDMADHLIKTFGIKKSTADGLRQRFLSEQSETPEND